MCDRDFKKDLELLSSGSSLDGRLAWHLQFDDGAWRLWGAVLLGASAKWAPLLTKLSFKPKYDKLF